VYITSVEQLPEALPAVFTLDQNYPNPFNPSTRIRFTLAQGGVVTLKVYDVLGREVATLVNQSLQPGSFETTFDGAGLSSGVYVYRLTANGVTATNRMMLTK
jgi:hypothetical protein